MDTKYCANCLASTQPQKLCRKIHYLQIPENDQVKSTLRTPTLKTISVKNALASIYKFNDKSHFKGQGQEKLTQQDKIGVCDSCVQLLTSLYKFYEDFNQRRSPLSYVQREVDTQSLIGEELTRHWVKLTAIQNRFGHVTHVETENRVKSPAPVPVPSQKENSKEIPDRKSKAPWVELVPLTPKENKEATQPKLNTVKINQELNFETIDISRDSSLEELEQMIIHEEEEEMTWEFEDTSDSINVQTSSSRPSQVNKSSVVFRIETKSCPVCSNSTLYETPEALYNHLKSHVTKNLSNEGICPLCFKAMKGSNLMVHLRRHVNYMPYKCTFLGCTKSFSRTQYLDKHTITHNNSLKMAPKKLSQSPKTNLDLLPPPLKLHTCSICRGSFISNVDLISHQITRHGIIDQSLNTQELTTPPKRQPRPRLLYNPEPESQPMRNKVKFKFNTKIKNQRDFHQTF